MWKDLTLQQKAEIMRMSVANGVTDINTIRDLYDGQVEHEFKGGGRVITIGELPEGFVRENEMVTVRDINNKTMSLKDAFAKSKGTHINTEDVPGLTDYLIRQNYNGVLPEKPKQEADFATAYKQWKEDYPILTTAASLLPVTSTIIDGLDLYAEPNWENAGWLAADIVLDLMGAKLIGKAAKGLRNTEGLETLTKSRWEAKAKGKPSYYHRRPSNASKNALAPEEVEMLSNAAGTAGVFAADVGTNLTQQQIEWNKKALGGYLFDKGGSKNKKKGIKGVNYHTSEAQAFVDELVAAGVRPVDAYAAAGNTFVESRFNHEASNNINGGHWGLLQNDANIRRHIIKYYGDYSRNSQMQFLKDGLTGQIKGAKNARWLQQRFDDYRRHSAGVKDASVAAKYFHDDYERSKNELVADRMRAASFYQTGIASNPSIATYNKIYGTPRLDISNDILYNPAQELQWTPITQESPKINPLSIPTNNIEIPIPKVEAPTVISIEERIPLEARLPNIASLLSYLPDQQAVVQPKVSAPQYVSTPIDVWDEPYLLFGRT